MGRREGALPLPPVPALPCLCSRALAPRRQGEPRRYWEHGVVMGFGYPEGRAEVKLLTGFQSKPSIKGLKAISLLNIRLLSGVFSAFMQPD